LIGADASGDIRLAPDIELTKNIVKQQQWLALIGFMQ
jgi:hypothetical protein